MRKSWSLAPFTVKQDWSGDLEIKAQSGSGISGVQPGSNPWSVFYPAFAKWAKRGWNILDAFEIGYEYEALVISQDLSSDEHGKISVRLGVDKPVWYVAACSSENVLVIWAAGNAVKFVKKDEAPSPVTGEWVKLEDMVSDHRSAEEAALELKQAESRSWYFERLLSEADPEYDGGEWNGTEWAAKPAVTCAKLDEARYPVECETCGAAIGVPCHHPIWGLGVFPRADVHSARADRMSGKVGAK